MATLSSLVVRITGNTVALNKSIQQAQTRLTKFRSAAQKAFGALRRAALGAAVIAGSAILGFGISSIKTFAETGDAIQKMALRTGFSTEALSELGFAAEQSGASLETIEKAAKRMAVTILDANMGLSTAVDALDLLGLSVKDLEGLAPEEQFLTLLNAIGGVEDASLRAALAQRIFGRSGTELLPLLANGAEGIARLRQEARDLGIVFSQDAANSAAEFTDAMNELNQAVKGIQFEVGGLLAPHLTDLARWFVDNRETIATFFNVARAVATPVFKSYIVGIRLVLGALGFLVRFFTDNRDTITTWFFTIAAVARTVLSPGGLLKTAFNGAIALVKSLSIDWGAVWDGIVSGTKYAINSVIGFINALIRAWNNASEFTLPSR